jgi:hypothetical protein
VTFAVALSACGSAHPAPPPPPGHAKHVDTQGSAPPPVAEVRPSEAECDAMFDHALALENAERPTDQQLSAAETVTVRAKLRTDHLAECRELSRASYRCLVEASTVATFTACK